MLTGDGFAIACNGKHLNQRRVRLLLRLFGVAISSILLFDYKSI
ncbi:hypothetical protein FDUTEX481_03760 [Tolypothrix sp. PCC 7601]|nr:hypothetical protein FDUTEX481_03760 [Tolypothrix sp. PCC 7601]